MHARPVTMQGKTWEVEPLCRFTVIVELANKKNSKLWSLSSGNSPERSKRLGVSTAAACIHKAHNHIAMHIAGPACVVQHLICAR